MPKVMLAYSGWLYPKDLVLPAAAAGPMDAFAFGWSNGGMLATFAAAAMPGLFRTIAPVAGYQYDLDAIKPRVMASHGDDDGGRGGVGGGALVAGGIASRAGGAHAVPMFMHHSR